MARFSWNPMRLFNFFKRDDDKAEIAKISKLLPLFPEKIVELKQFFHSLVDEKHLFQKKKDFLQQLMSINVSKKETRLQLIYSFNKDERTKMPGIGRFIDYIYCKYDHQDKLKAYYKEDFDAPNWIRTTSRLISETLTQMSSYLETASKISRPELRTGCWERINELMKEYWSGLEHNGRWYYHMPDFPIFACEQVTRSIEKIDVLTNHPLFDRGTWYCNVQYKKTTIRREAALRFFKILLAGMSKLENKATHELLLYAETDLIKLTESYLSFLQSKYHDKLVSICEYHAGLPFCLIARVSESLSKKDISMVMKEVYSHGICHSIPIETLFEMETTILSWTLSEPYRNYD